MKGLLTWHDQAFRKTHNLVELGVQCSALFPDLSALLQRTASMTEYATVYRYPGIFAEPDEQEASDAEALAREVVDRVLDLLPPEVTQPE